MSIGGANYQTRTDTHHGKIDGKNTRTVLGVYQNIGAKPICADFMYIDILACIYRFCIYNFVMEREKPKERQATMNTAYKNFLNDALYDYCKANGIDLGDLIDHIEFRAAHPFTVSDGNGGKRTVAEPNAYEYARHDGMNPLRFELQDEINNASYDVLDWQANLETACANAGIDIEDVLCD